MKKENRIGFIGFGNIARAIAQGLVGAGACPPDRIFACAAHFDKLRENTGIPGIHAVKSAEEVIRNCDFIILAVKPHAVEAVLKPVLDALKNKVVVSVVAGYDFDQYEELLKPHTHHISTIPNTPISVGEGILVCEERHSLTPDELDEFTRLFRGVALLEFVNTAQLSAAGTLSGCTPAFTAMYLEALADAGVKHGISRAAACRIAAKMLCGTGKLYLESGTHPGAIKDAVCSPGGTTIRGVASLEKNGFRGAVIEAIDAIEE